MMGMRQMRAAGLVAAALGAALGGFGCAGAALAQTSSCPGHPDALGTSRVLAVDPAEYPRVGIMQYPQSLPLADKEVVLTFDDGPLARYSNQILDELAAQCVKATYFLVGEMARAYPATVRRIYEEGHTIGTHSEDHPARFDKIPIDKVRWEIDQGIADVAAALGDPKKVAPFFRIPGLGRTEAVEQELAARGLAVFSSDTVADDWHHRIKPEQIIAIAMRRLEKRGRGILLLHDIHPATAAALPGLLKELKDNGFRIVQVVPAPSAVAPEIPVAGASAPALAAATPSAADDSSAGHGWPRPTASAMSSDATLPAPDATAFDVGYADSLAAAFEPDVDDDKVKWPAQPATVPVSARPELAAPSLQDTGMPLLPAVEGSGPARHAALAPRASVPNRRAETGQAAVHRGAARRHAAIVHGRSRRAAREDRPTHHAAAEDRPPRHAAAERKATRHGAIEPAEDRERPRHARGLQAHRRMPVPEGERKHADMPSRRRT